MGGINRQKQYLCGQNEFIISKFTNCLQNRRILSQFTDKIEIEIKFFVGNVHEKKLSLFPFIRLFAGGIR